MNARSGQDSAVGLLASARKPALHLIPAYNEDRFESSAPAFEL